MRLSNYRKITINSACSIGLLLALQNPNFLFKLYFTKFCFPQYLFSAIFLLTILAMLIIHLSIGDVIGAMCNELLEDCPNLQRTRNPRAATSRASTMLHHRCRRWASPRPGARQASCAGGSIMYAGNNEKEMDRNLVCFCVYQIFRVKNLI
jgi:hypothetical protein